MTLLFNAPPRYCHRSETGGRRGPGFKHLIKLAEFLLTRLAEISFGDRACLALAARRGATALTADLAWRELTVPVEIRTIRHRV